MNIIISGKNFSLTPSLKNYVNDKVSKVFHYWNKIIRARVELDVDHNQTSGERYRAVIWLEIPGKDIEVGGKANDMHAAIDMLMPKLERLIVKAKDKGQLLIRRQKRSTRV